MRPSCDDQTSESPLQRSVAPFSPDRKHADARLVQLVNCGDNRGESGVVKPLMLGVLSISCGENCGPCDRISESLGCPGQDTDGDAPPFTEGRLLVGRLSALRGLGRGRAIEPGKWWLWCGS